MELMRRLDQVTDWFTPEGVRDDPHAKKRVRMFLISHLFGPLLGAPIPLFLYVYDPQPVAACPHARRLDRRLLAVPARLEAVAAPIRDACAGLGAQPQQCAILWGSYHYGGASSPFLMWFLVMPLLAFFYLGSSTKTRLIIFAQIIVGLSAFYAAFLMENSFPSHIPIHQMVGVGVVSAFCAATYVFLMASYYSSVVDSQSESAQGDRPPPEHDEDADRSPRTTPNAPTAPSRISSPR